jgi:general secretion pathway protein G
VSRETERRCRHGFTLVEVIVVLAVLATLAAVVAPMVFRHVADARVQAARSQIEIFMLALDGYYADTGVYPTTDQGLRALRREPVLEPLPRGWRGPYLRRAVPLDPWGREFIYTSPGVRNTGSYDLATLGRDGRVGGSGEDADIHSDGDGDER